MKKTRLKLAAYALIGLSCVSAQASSGDRTFGEIYTQCGLGGLLSNPMKDPFKEPMAVITNITWDLGTTAITSNISSDGTCAGDPTKVAAFINTSYDKLEQELAQGEGEYLDTLVSMTKPADTTKEAYIASIRSDFANVVASNSSDFEKKEALYKIVM